MNMANRHLPPHINNLEVTQSRFEVIPDRLVHPFVLVDPPEEVALGFFARHVCVVWVAGGDLETDVCVDD